jgi:hypothetical protein
MDEGDIFITVLKEERKRTMNNFAVCGSPKVKYDISIPTMPKLPIFIDTETSPATLGFGRAKQVGKK